MVREYSTNGILGIIEIVIIKHSLFGVVHKVNIPGHTFNNCLLKSLENHTSAIYFSSIYYPTAQSKVQVMHE